MKASTIQIVLIVLFSIKFTGLIAQNTTAATGGEATGNGGIVSYTIGQTFINVNTGDSGYIIEGVQQPYEISITLIKNSEDTNPDIKIYPNPTSSYLNLNVGNNYTVDMSYKLYDADGKKIQSNDINNKGVHIKMGTYSPGTYFLKVFKGKNEIKVFKIIKNI